MFECDFVDVFNYFAESIVTLFLVIERKEYTRCVFQSETNAVFVLFRNDYEIINCHCGVSDLHEESHAAPPFFLGNCARILSAHSCVARNFSGTSSAALTPG